MNWFVFLVFFGGLLANVCAKYCQNANQCKEGQCCLFMTLNKPEGKGYCRRMGRLSDQCSEPESINEYYGGKFIKHCPCRDGLECKPDRPRRGKFEIRRTCRQPGTTEPPVDETTITTEPPEEETAATTETPVDDNEVTTAEEEIPPEEMGQGPGGEPPRDDDCVDWEYPC